MKRRDFIKNTSLALVGAFASPTTMAKNSDDEGGKFIEYYRDVCHTLEGLNDFATGEVYKPDDFVLAYFCTPYQSYPGQGCASDILNLVQGARFANMYLPKETRVTPLLVISPLQKGDVGDSFVRNYTDADKGGLNVRGLTGRMDDVLETAQNYRASFEVDRVSEHIKGHNRSAVLISPKGELLVKYAPSYLSSMHGAVANHVKLYKNHNISPARGCDM